MVELKSDLKLYVGTVELFDPKKHLDMAANLYAAYFNDEFAGMPEVLTASQLAKFLQVSPPTAYELMRRTDFPTINLSTSPKGTKRVLRHDLIKWLKDHRSVT